MRVILKLCYNILEFLAFHGQGALNLKIHFYPCIDRCLTHLLVAGFLLSGVFKMQELLSENKCGETIITSIQIAKIYGKSPSVVNRTIVNYVRDVVGDFGACKIARTSYLDVQGKERTMYELTEEEALIITGRFTGKIAAQHQRKIARAFIAMRDYIRNHQNNALAEYQKQLSAQSAQLAIVNQREPRDEKTLAVIMNCPTRQVTKHFDILVRNGYLNRKELPPVTRYTYEATHQIGALCIGKKGDSLLFDDKVKDLIGLLNQTESLFD
jgi:Rha family phage regulatory protein